MQRRSLRGIWRKTTDLATIQLALSIPRKLNLRGRAIQIAKETELLSSAQHFILLGDPGAGKTTTLKRLARHLFNSESNIEDDLQYAVVVRLRELSQGQCLLEHLARVFGLRAERKSMGANADSDYELFIGVDLAVDVLRELLEDTKALILLDGLDEVKPDIRKQTEQSIVEMARFCRTAKIVVTCRSGDYTHALEPLQPVEITPLDDSQIRSIVTLWSDDSVGFLKSLSKVPFADLASRPLFLGQLMVLYHNRGSIPSRPVDVYRRVVRLAVEEWDRLNVRRRSRYSEFDADTKIDFLAALAHHLTYTLKSQVFTVDQLLDAYNVIHKRFALPRREAREVIAEVETHTGIFIEAGYQRFEFSHLSLQEFLCAYSLRDRPVTADLLRALLDNPAPVAILVALSSESSDWLSAMFLNRAVTRGKLKEYRLQSFFARLLQERPVLVPTNELGYASLRIRFEMVEIPLDEYTARFLALPAVLSATAAVLPSYIASHLDNRHLQLVLKYPWQHRDDLVIPAMGTIAESELNRILEGQPVKMRKATADGARQVGGQLFDFADNIAAHRNRLD